MNVFSIIPFLVIAALIIIVLVRSMARGTRGRTRIGSHVPPSPLSANETFSGTEQATTQTHHEHHEHHQHHESPPTHHTPPPVHHHVPPPPTIHHTPPPPPPMHH